MTNIKIMKELSIEEKAQAYDEAIKKVNDFYEGKTKLYSDVDKTLNYLFPELKESEDERIIQWIRKELEDKYVTDNIVNNEMADKALAWLEKQGEHETNEWKEGNIIRHGGILALVIKGRRAIKSNGEMFTIQYPDEWVKAESNEIECFLKELEKRGEQKQDVNMQINPSEYINDMGGNGCYLKNTTQMPTDKVEPKFHEGEWITNGDYTWQIVMVKSLDYILQSQGGNIVEDTISHVDEHFHSFVIQDAKDGDVLCVKYGNEEMPFIFTGKQDNIAYCALNSFGEFVLSMAEWLLKEFVLPATKEQRDILFQKMKEAGYEWNADKKELKIIDWSKHIKYEPNSPSITKEYPAWSEEDEKNFNEAISYVKDTALRNWLISFKGKVQPKQEWSKEDEEIFNELIAYFISDMFLNHTEEDIVNWLKSLKERVQSKPLWKPSEEQMEALLYEVYAWDEDSINGQNLKSLYQDLNKLKE